MSAHRCRSTGLEERRKNWRITDATASIDHLARHSGFHVQLKFASYSHNPN
jgi:hypothetical protein